MRTGRLRDGVHSELMQAHVPYRRLLGNVDRSTAEVRTWEQECSLDRVSLLEDEHVHDCEHVRVHADEDDNVGGGVRERVLEGAHKRVRVREPVHGLDDELLHVDDVGRHKQGPLHRRRGHRKHDAVGHRRDQPMSIESSVSSDIHDVERLIECTLVLPEATDYRA